MFHLVVHGLGSKHDDYQRIPIGQSPIVIGRDQSCDVTLPAAGVTRRHARIIRQPDGHYLEDLGSRNGTSLNGQRVTSPVRLQAGDRIQIVDYELTFVETASEAVPFQIAVPPARDQSRKSKSLRILNDTRKVLATGNSLAERLHGVVDRLLESFDEADRCLILMCQDGDKPTVLAGTSRGHAQGHSYWFSEEVVNKCIESKAPYFAAGPASGFPLGSVFCVPLATSIGATLGVLQLDARERVMKFTRIGKHVLGIAAVLVAGAIDHAVHQGRMDNFFRNERQLRDARQVQRLFLPQELPRIDGYDFYVYDSPQMEVGGDYYDFIPLPDGRIVMVVADVAGKGVPAALVMARVSAMTRQFIREVSEPALAVKLLNDQLYEEIPDKFVTLLVIVLDPARHRISVINAGTHAALISRCGIGETERLERIGLESAGLPVGIMREATWSIEHAYLSPGDYVMAFTDGVTHISDRNFEFFGEERLLQVVHDEFIRAEESLSPRRLGEHVVRAALQHTGGRGQNDDMTLMCFGRLRGEAEHHEEKSVQQISSRHVNAWLEEGKLPLVVSESVRIGVNIGVPREGTIGGGAFVEPDWGHWQQLDIVVCLNGPGATVTPAAQPLTVPKKGETPPVFFDVVPRRPGSLELYLSIYLAREMTLLEEFLIRLTVGQALAEGVP